MGRIDDDLFAPLHGEEPPGAWDRIVAGLPDGAPGETSYLDAPLGRPHSRRWLLAAAVLLVVCAVGGALLVRGGDTDAPADGVAAGPCPFELEVPGARFEPVERSKMIPPEDIGPLGAVTVLRAEDGDLLVEVFAGHFDPETFHQAATAYESGPGPGPGEDVLTAVPFTPASGRCTMWGIYATGLDWEATEDVFRSVVDDLSAR